MSQPRFYEGINGSQYDSHGYSYLFAREQLQAQGEIMGIDKILIDIINNEMESGLRDFKKSQFPHVKV